MLSEIHCQPPPPHHESSDHAGAHTRGRVRRITTRTLFRQVEWTVAAPAEQDRDRGSQGFPTRPGPSDTFEDIERVHIIVLEEGGWILEGRRQAAACLAFRPSMLRHRMKVLRSTRPRR